MLFIKLKHLVRTWTTEAWMKEFFLKLNPSKTKIMVVAPPGVRKEIVVNGTFLSGKCVCGNS